MADTDKLGYLPQLQRYDEKLKRWANNEFLTKVAAAATDVRIAGKSITEGGVADIPAAVGNEDDSNKNSYGVVKSRGASFGILLHQDGICTASAAANEIDSRKNHFKPIPPALLDYAVKAAMCDGKGAAWTDKEQAAAKERMGIGNYSIPKATATTLGGVKVGYGLSVTDDGMLSAEDDIVFTWNFDTSAFSCNKTFAEVKKIITTGVRRTATANGLLENFSITLLAGAANDNGVMFFGTAPTNTLLSGMLGSRIKETTTYLFQRGLAIMYMPNGQIQMTEDLSDLITNMSFDFKNTTFQYDRYNSFDLKDGGITSAKLANGAVTAAKLASGAVTSDKITNGAVSSAKLALNAVTSDKIKDGAVSSAKLALNAVIAEKIKDGAIVAEKIKDGGITSAKLADGAVTADKISDGAITKAKLASDVSASDMKYAQITRFSLGNLRRTSEPIIGNNVFYFDNFPGTGKTSNAVIAYNLIDYQDFIGVVFKYIFIDEKSSSISIRFVDTKGNATNYSSWIDSGLIAPFPNVTSTMPSYTVSAWSGTNAMQASDKQPIYWVPKSTSAQAALASLLTVQDECEQMKAEVAKIEQDWIDNPDDTVAVDGNGVPITITTKKTELEKKQAELEKLREDYISKLGDWKNEVQE